MTGTGESCGLGRPLVLLTTFIPSGPRIILTWEVWFVSEARNERWCRVSSSTTLRTGSRFTLSPIPKKRHQSFLGGLYTLSRAESWLDTSVCSLFRFTNVSLSPSVGSTDGVLGDPRTRNTPWVVTNREVSTVVPRVIYRWSTVDITFSPSQAVSLRFVNYK